MSNCLPAEILDNIFRNLQNKDRKQCSLTCRSWKSPAQRALFTILNLKEDQHLYDFANTMSYNSIDLSPANFVRVLTCEFLSESFDLTPLDSLFPFVEIIYIADTHYDKFRQLVLQGAFPKLKKLPHRRKWDKDHLELVLARKENITELDITALCLDVFEKLHLFSKLKSLTLSVFEDSSTVCIERLLPNDLPQLTSIRLLLYMCKLNLNLASVIQPLKKLENVEIYSDEAYLKSEESYYYLMNKFPHPRVLRLFSGLNTQFRKRHHTVPSVECLSQFLIYLFNIKILSAARYIITDHHTPQAVAKFLKYALDQKSKDYKDVELHLTLKFYVVEEDEQDDYPENRIAYIEVNNSIKSEKKISEITANYKTIVGSTSLAYVNLFQELGDVCIDYLTIGFTEVHEGEDRIPLILDTVFDHLTKLKTLNILYHRHVT